MAAMGVCCSALLQEGACGEGCSPLTASSYSISKIHSSLGAGYMLAGGSRSVREGSRAPQGPVIPACRSGCAGREPESPARWQRLLAELHLSLRLFLLRSPLWLFSFHMCQTRKLFLATPASLLLYLSQSIACASNDLGVRSVLGLDIKTHGTRTDTTSIVMPQK